MLISAACSRASGGGSKNTAQECRSSLFLTGRPCDNQKSPRGKTKLESKFELEPKNETRKQIGKECEGGWRGGGQ